MNDADRATIVDRLKRGCSAASIHAELPDVSVGEIAAIAETEGLTKAHTKAGASPIPDIDPQLARALAALAWGENSHTARVRNLAKRTRDGLTELIDLQANAGRIAAAEAEVAALQKKLATARTKLHRAKNGKPQMPMAEIRAWAKGQGMKVSDGGVLPKSVIDAWKRRNTTATVPAQRQAG